MATAVTDHSDCNYKRTEQKSINETESAPINTAESVLINTTVGSVSINTTESAEDNKISKDPNNDKKNGPQKTQSTETETVAAAAAPVVWRPPARRPQYTAPPPSPVLQQLVTCSLHRYKRRPRRVRRTASVDVHHHQHHIHSNAAGIPATKSGPVSIPCWVLTCLRFSTFAHVLVAKIIRKNWNANKRAQQHCRRLSGDLCGAIPGASDAYPGAVADCIAYCRSASSSPPKSSC